jgi:hypothetical protein
VIRLRVNITKSAAAGLRNAAEQLPDQLGALTQQTAEATQAALIAAAPISKPRPNAPTPGSLKRSIMFDLEGTTATFMASQVAEYVIGGTDPHDIQPNGKQALAFFWDVVGDNVVFMRVHHPGTRPNDFRVPALDEASAQADALLDGLADELAGNLNA